MPKKNIITKLEIDKEKWAKQVAPFFVEKNKKEIIKLLMKYTEPNATLLFSENRYSGKISFSPDELSLLKQKLEKYSELDKKTGCIVWTGGKDYDGYGATGFMKKQIKAHRASYLINHGNIEIGFSVCHTCDNPSCINPSHLWAGTNQENQLDCSSKLRRNGELVGTSTFSNKEIIEIRRMFASGLSVRDIASKLKRSKSTIGKICHKRTWAHIKNY